MSLPFRPIAAALLAATTSSQVIAMPAQAYATIQIHNGGTGTAYLTIGSNIAIPGAAFVPGIFVVAAGATLTFQLLNQNGEARNLAYIASVAGTIDVTLGVAGS